MPFDTHKLDNLILYLGNSPHVENLGITKLWKLIYFIDVAFCVRPGPRSRGRNTSNTITDPCPAAGISA